jgi:hypothetical protein
MFHRGEIVLADANASGELLLCHIESVAECCCGSPH